MDSQLSQAKEHLTNGATQEAEALFQVILKDNPNEAEALNGMALVVGQKGDHAQAFELVKRATDLCPDEAKYQSNLSVFARLLGKLDEALIASGKAITQSPQNATFWNNRGNALCQAGRYADAETCFHKAIELKPDYAEAHFNLGNLLRDQNKLEKAHSAYAEAVGRAPSLWQAHLQHGETLFDLRRHEDALEAFLKAYKIADTSVPAMLGVGKCQHRRGHYDEALEWFTKSTQTDPRNATAFLYRGRTLNDLKRYPEAERALKQSLALAVDKETYLQLGIALINLGRVDDAVEALDACVKLDPNMVLALFHKTNLLRRAGRLDEALEAVMQALKVKPDQPEFWNSLGNIAKVRWHLHSARDAFEKALELNPNLDPAVNNLGGVYKGLTDLKRAREYYERSIELSPKNLDFIGNLLFTANYDPDIGEEELAKMHRDFASRLQEGVTPKTNHTNSRDPDRRLRVGFVSGDLGRHPTGYFLEGVLRYADPKAVHYTCYSNRLKEDDITARLKGYSDRWRQVSGMTAEVLCDLVEQDEIDILIDLSCHTAATRLDCFVHKPAPVQMTWVGSCHTSGLDTIDYVIMDPYYVLEGDEHLFTEELIRLPDIRWVYRLRDHLPDVAPPPVTKNGFITFGSFNNLTKVNERVIDVWSAVLKKVPTSKLMVSWRSLVEPVEQERIRTKFQEHGIDPDRLILTRGNENGRTVFEEYGDVDIMLDAFPFSGCITTCEALSMGVPIVTLPGRRPCSRQTHGFLTAIDRKDWIADNPDHYVEIAARLASDTDELAAMRAAQRDRIEASPMCDAKSFAHNLEVAFRDAWVKWCNS